MAKVGNARGRKARMNRSETVSIRLDPRLNYLCDLAARSQRRTKSSFIEAAIDEKINSMKIENWHDTSESATLGQRANDLWDVQEIERLISLAFAAPHLMSFDEQEIWSVISQNGYFWHGKYRGYGDTQDWNWDHEITFVNRSNIESEWERILLVAQGELDKSELPTVEPRTMTSGFRSRDDPLDDDIPF